MAPACHDVDVVDIVTGCVRAALEELSPQNCQDVLFEILLVIHKYELRQVNAVRAATRELAAAGDGDVMRAEQAPPAPSALLAPRYGVDILSDRVEPARKELSPQDRQDALFEILLVIHKYELRQENAVRATTRDLEAAGEGDVMCAEQAPPAPTALLAPSHDVDVVLDLVVTVLKTLSPQDRQDASFEILLVIHKYELRQLNAARATARDLKAAGDGDVIRGEQARPSRSGSTTEWTVE